MKFGHVALRVKNVSEMLNFYCEGLQLKEAFRINNDDGSLRIIYLHISDNQYLELCLGGTNKLEFDDQKSVGVRHFCFTVENLVSSKMEMEKRGVKFDSEILTLRDKNPTVYLFDPDGNKIEIVEISKDSPQYKFQNSA